MYAVFALSSLAFSQELPPEEPPAAVAHAPAGRGKASGVRFVVNMLGSGLVGGAAAYGTMAAACGGGELCLGGSVGGALVNIGVTPLAAWGLGRAMGGRGDLGMTYVGGLLPFTATAPIAVESPGAALGVSLVLMPVTSALTFELSSHMKSVGPVQSVQVEPYGDGARLRVAGTF
jgi:hypothetical protein